jgi:hypothetical protein
MPNPSILRRVLGFAALTPTYVNYMNHRIPSQLA